MTNLVDKVILADQVQLVLPYQSHNFINLEERWPSTSFVPDDKIGEDLPYIRLYLSLNYLW